MRIHLSVQEFNFGLRQQCFLTLILPGEDLRGEQLSDALSQRTVDRAEQTVFAS